MADSPAAFRARVLDALVSCGWNQSDAAFKLGIRRETVNRRLAEWGGPDGLRAMVVADRSQPTQGSQESHVIRFPVITPDTADTVQLNATQSITSLTNGKARPRLSNVNAEAEPTEMLAVNGVRIPAISVQLDAEEDLFVSQEIGVGRVTGGPKTRVAVIKQALRFYMDHQRSARGNGGTE